MLRGGYWRLSLYQVEYIPIITRVLVDYNEENRENKPRDRFCVHCHRAPLGGPVKHTTLQKHLLGNGIPT